MSEEEYTPPSLSKRFADLTAAKSTFTTMPPNLDWLREMKMARPPVAIRARWAPDARDWCDAWELKYNTAGNVLLYKATNRHLTTGDEYARRVEWRVGETVTCVDWNPAPICGGGLHLCPTIRLAASYRYQDPILRYLQVEVAIEDIVPIPSTSRPYQWDRPYGGHPMFSRDQVDKCKVRSCRVVTLVDGYGNPITDESLGETA